MRILLYGINYAPELTGIGKYTGEMAVWLAARGHDVHVLTGMPYYPEWQVNAAYKKKGWHTEMLDGVHVHRVPMYVPKTVSSLKRIVHEFSFLVSSIPYWIQFLFQRKFDLLCCIAPPFHIACMPWLYTSIRRTTWINHIQDLQVDAAKELGMIKNQLFLTMLFRMDRFFLRKGSYVTTISAGMTNKIIAKGIFKENMLLFPNWVDSQLIYPLPKEQSMRGELGFDLKEKIVLYSGNLGEKQGLDAIIRAAERFTVDPTVKFVICGSGGAKDRLVELAKRSQLDNVFFIDLQPYEKLSRLLAMADIHLVLQKGSAGDLVMPSKLTGILAAGGCALVTALPGTSLYQEVTSQSMGIVVPPDDEDQLIIGLKEGLYGDVAVYQRNARKYAEQFLDKQAILARFEKVVQSLL